MKKIIIKIAFVFFLVLFTTACDVNITKSNLKLKKGISIKFFKNEVKTDYQITLEKLNSKYNAKYLVCVKTITGVDADEIYYYAFKNDSLIFWGHPFKFTRHENNQIRDIGEEMIPIVKDKYHLKW